MQPLVFIGTWWVAVQLLGLGNTVGYHRLLTHRAFRTGPGVRAVLTLLGALHSGSPVFWVGLHRLHHLRSDGPEDPHSPEPGFWWGHCGWIVGVKSPWVAIPFALSGFGQQAALLWHDLKRLAGRNPPEWRTFTPDLWKEPLMRWLDVPMVMPAIFAAQLGLAWWIAGGWGILWLWAVHVWLTNASWAVNSICHDARFGHAPFDTGDGSRDVWWMAWATNGEGFHNAHHRFPRSARHALEGGSDLSWTVIRALVATGLAWDPWLPKKYRDAA